MRNYKILISYDGTKYKGWQRLGQDRNTIQYKMEQAISELIGYNVTIDGSGRTDSGVHASGQVANVKISRKVDEDDFKDKLNERLEEDIRILDVKLVKNSFHSRLSAKGKQYIYTIDTREKADVFGRKYAYHYPEPLDIDNMRSAARLLIGTHDYSAFCDKKEEKSGIRSIHRINIIEQGTRIKMEYYGNGFLNHMVRILTGTLLEVGSGQREESDIHKALESGKRMDAGYTAPAKGLRLQEVYYDSI